MAHKYVLLLLVRVVLPGALLFSIALRPFGLSILYLLLYLIAPMMPALPDRRSTSSGSGKLIILTLVISSSLLLVHAAWHSLLAAFPPYGSLLHTNPLIERLGHNLGLVSYKHIQPLMGVHYLAPELVMSSASLIILLIHKKLETVLAEKSIQLDSKYQAYPFLTSAGRYVSLLLVMFSGILSPSAISAIYYAVFMGCATAWSVGLALKRAYAVVLRCVMAIMAVHTAVILAYQCNWAEELLPPEMNIARYLGLTKIVDIDEKKPNAFTYEGMETGLWTPLASPLVILLTYYVLGVETIELFKPKREKKSLPDDPEGKENGGLIRGLSFHSVTRSAAKERWLSASRKANASVAFTYISSKDRRGTPTETTPFLMSPSRTRWQSSKRKAFQDSTGSVILRDEDFESGEAEQATMVQNIVAAIIDFFQIMVRSSYIATTITMMAWSIMYHSWLTFVFLMWANIVWLCHDQRSFMLRTSPILVIYAMMLLVLQYIYSLDLNNDELPANSTDVNLQQIGIVRVEWGTAFKPLLIKSLFTCMFWVTLRQRVQELRARRAAAAAAHLAAPLHLTVSTAASAIEARQEEESRSHLIRVLGEFLKGLCARYWIYVVAIMLFVIGITGERMTIFRILYMFLFLAFVLVFQISWHWWRKLMYMFWIVVIIYSMINLILIYVYQFDNFSKLIEKYLFINEKLQHDLGLEPYHPADLFVKLLTPTCFLIITIMQVHYFHKDFLALSDPKAKSTTSKDPQSSRPSQGVSTIRDDISQLPIESERPGTATDQEGSIGTDPRQSVGTNTYRSVLKSRQKADPDASMKTTFKNWVRVHYICCRIFIKEAIDLVFIYLDIHLIKVIFVGLMLLCIFNVCAMHVPIMILICPALLLKQRQQRICVLVVSLLISIYFMAKMVYQIDYISHDFFAVVCERIRNNTVVEEVLNNAEWFGFLKATKEKPLVTLLKGYIGLIAIFTFYSIVLYRQEGYREKHKLGIQKIMFPGIKRVDADKDLPHCMKYLMNYGFYKFGVEITLICLMGVIGSRMDVYAVIYAIWLLLLVFMNRQRQASIWRAFTAYVTIVIPVQYLVAVGFLPQFCIDYPWNGSDTQMKHIRNWFFLPHTKDPPHTMKLIFDYFLLLFATLQLKVFKIENKQGDTFAGGSNSEDIGKDWETPNFVNPVPDFLGFFGTWLDVLKRLVFLGMLWVTLAIMFMTGTNRVNLFSMGYLIGSFIFLWQGTDFYLLPKSSILQWWSWLLRYNVSVVVIKTLLQIPGCIFGTVMQNNACWLVQLLGIGCVDKFAGGSISRFLKMDYVKVYYGAVSFAACCLVLACYFKYSVPQEDIGLAWDGVCFAFLILQRRLFHSYYFFRVIDESKATTVLASRGAELIEELRLKQMQLQKEQEEKILEKIKVKMERIKAYQRRIQGIAKDPETHDIAVRSGDYYMFEDYDDTEIPFEDPDQRDDDAEAPKGMGLGKLVSTLIKTDLRQALAQRRASMPAVRSQRHSFSRNTHSMQEARPTSPLRSSGQYERGFGDEGPSRGPPGSSRGHTEYSGEDTMKDEIPEGDTWFEKLQRLVEAVKAFMTSFIITITRQLMKHSRDYRYISRTLTMEKKLLKEREGFGFGLREGAQMRWEPLPETLSSGRKLSEISVPEIRILAPSMERGLDSSPAPSPRATPLPSIHDDDTSEHESAFSLQSTESKDITQLEEQDDSMLKSERPPLLHLLYALWYAVLAHTDIVCYIMVFVNQIQSATILSIPLPLMVFLWGTLTIPRPTRTFWVTLIAYTEVIVIIKSMFQFEILPWNQKVIPANMPFSAPRIIGIERKSNYALYDLLLLLIIFLHRFMLKSLGLWKESTPDIELRKDMVFELKPEDTAMLMEGRGAEVGRKYFKLHDKMGPRHRLVDRLRHVELTIETVMRELQTTRSDPRVIHLVNQELQLLRAAERRRARRRKIERRPHISSLSLAHSEQFLSFTSHFHETSEHDTGNSIQQESSGDEPGPSKHSDEDHYNVNDDQEPIIAVITNKENPMDHFPSVVWLSVKRYLRPSRLFFKRMLAPGARVTADVYAYMFLCDFINFLVVIFGFAAFGTHQGDGGVQTYLEENKVPIPFLVMLILQFALIVIDRALYLRKFMLGKILFQYTLIIGVHIWMFFVLPVITERTFNTLPPPPIWYMVKCLYLLLSAYQIRCGYPRRIIGNFLCKSYRFLNMVAFRGFMGVPFVFELRTLMDWIWTDTSMHLMDWLKMEDIFASVYLLKCSRYVETEWPQPRGMKKSSSSKYLLGGSVLAFVIAIIWFPLVFFAFGNTVGQPNPPTDVTVKIRIGPFLPIYQMSAQSHNIAVFSQQDYTQLSNMYGRDRTAQTFLSNYMYNDIAVVTLNPNSTMKWEISPPELDRLEREAESNASLSVKFTFVITHPSNTAQNPPTIESNREVALEAYDSTLTIRNPEREILYNMLVNKSDPDTWLTVKMLFPKFLKVFNKGTAKAAHQLTALEHPEEVDEKRLQYRDVQMRLERDRGAMYWRVRELCSVKDTLSAIPMNNCDMLVMYTFNDKLFPETLNFISGGGIIGLYTTFVFLASRVIRGFFSGIYTKIMFDDLPNVDRVLQLCLDIYLVREALELSLEEDLFAKLVFLYRSPETMIKWTRPKEEEDQQEEAQRALPPSR